MIKQAVTLFLSVIVGSLSCTGADFILINSGKSLNIYISDNESEVVYTALEIFGSDLESVSGKSPTLLEKMQSGALFVGTIGNDVTDNFINSNSIKTDDIEGEWEAYRIISLTNKNFNDPILAVIGSDPRGTAYGLLELSRIIGVSPWEWWADVIPAKKQNVTIPVGFEKTDKPSVQFRGIFLNDEDWGLVPWSSQTFEPSGKKGQIGVRTYSKIFELLLRLRANTLWPAMHEQTVPFYMVEGTTEASQKYGIVIGSSHCEPLLCNSAGEWDEDNNGRYNFLTNRTNVVNYWESRLQQISGSDNYFLTIGMRGKHDGKMEGVNTTEEYHDALVEVIKTQRDLITKNLQKDPAEVPQAFIPYKEVLEVYDYGLDVPDDVTLVWCDDNYGYLTRLTNEKERQRSGGAGIYYHISYWGRPHDYLWLCSTQPSQIYSEMRKAWDYGARKLWILNVGDIKPAEYNIEFFMDMAWDIESVNNKNIYNHLEKWCEREFGNEGIGSDLSVVMREYYRLGMERKPEHMGWSQVEVSGAPRGRTPVIDTDFNPFMFGDEIEKRISDYEKIENIVDSIYEIIPSYRKDAFYQLMKYPVSAATEMNKKLLYAQKARMYADNGLSASNYYREKSINAYNNIISLTDHYNKVISGGKWNRIMDMSPRQLYVFNEPDLPELISGKNSLVIWQEGSDLPLSGNEIKLSTFIKEAGNTNFLSLFNLDGGKWSVYGMPEWLMIYETTASEYETCLEFRVDNSKIKKNENTSFRLLLDDHVYTIFSSVLVAGVDASAYEYDGMIALNASQFSNANGEQVICGYGHSGNAVSLGPTFNFTDGEPYLEYNLYVSSTGPAKIRTYIIPVHPVNGGDTRIAMSIDGGEPIVKSYKTAFRSEIWKLNVMRNQAIIEADYLFETPGLHSLKVYALDPDMVIDQVMVDFEENRNFYRVPVN